jgi:orotidine-5'-phosphate decarboxylase
MPTKENNAELILALDVDTFEEAKHFVNELYPAIKIFKVGSQLFTGTGPKIIEYIRGLGAEVFLDLKFFDIPNTVAHAARQAVRMGVKMLTLHILGDEEMIAAAKTAAAEEAKALKAERPLLIGVTVLTSKEANFNEVLILAKMGIECGLDGVVCSAREVAPLKEAIKEKFIAITPGIRAQDAAANDQKRTASAAQALKAGSNFLVVGRPIIEAKDPRAAAQKLLGEIHGTN